MINNKKNYKVMRKKELDMTSTDIISLNHFPLEARNNINKMLGVGKKQLETAIITGFFYRDLNNDKHYSLGEEITATLLGKPYLEGSNPPLAKLYSNCFLFAPLKVDQKYILHYNVDGFESFSQEISTSAGLNIINIPISPQKFLVYVQPHSHFDPEWRATYQEYLDIEIPQLLKRLNLLKKEPGHCFSLDEECATRPLIELHPEIKEELKQRILEGVVEPKGIITAGELTMPLGESMIRQMIDGENLISELLGIVIRPEVFWNIDNYGINYQLPQILSKAKRKYLVLGEYNHPSTPERLPFSNPLVWEYPEFWFEGLDGSKVLVHRSGYCEGGTQGSHIPKEQILSHKSIFHFHGCDFSPPDTDLLEKLKKNNDANSEFKYIIATSRQFFKAVEKSPELPTFRTESYIGRWTGSFESRIKGRQLNRQLEYLILSIEALSTIGNIVGMSDIKNDLREAWYLLLINHHHDPQLTIMSSRPATDPNSLFEEVLHRYIQVRNKLENIQEKILDFLINKIKTNKYSGIPIVIFNSLAWNRSKTFELDLPNKFHSKIKDNKAISISDTYGKQYKIQINGEKVLFHAKDVPALGWQTYYLQDNTINTNLKSKNHDYVIKSPAVFACEDFLENNHIRLELEEGMLKKIIKKSDGQSIFETKSEAGINEIFIWQDLGCIARVKPIDFMKSASLVGRSSKVEREVKVVEEGPKRATIEVSFNLDWGKFKQKIILESDARWIHFNTQIDWQPDPKGGRRIRVSFPSALKNLQVWRDIPFAVIPWKQTETIQPVNSWIGISNTEEDQGAALIHQGTCSTQVSKDILWMTLFRSVIVPEKEGEDNCVWDIPGDKALEEGLNNYHYWIYPYNTDWQTAHVQQAAIEVNTPLYGLKTDRHPGNLEDTRSILSIAPKDLVVSAFKVANYTNSSIIRIYNPTTKQVKGLINAGFRIKIAEETDFREQKIQTLKIKNDKVSLFFKPYEIKTIRLVKANPKK